MRKRNIKSVAHWVIMSILLLFPVLMVGISAFANNEQSVTVTETNQYQTSEIDYDDVQSSLVNGNIYQFFVPFLEDTDYEDTQYSFLTYSQYVRVSYDIDNKPITLDFSSYSGEYLYLYLYYYGLNNDDTCEVQIKYLGVTLFDIADFNYSCNVYFVYDDDVYTELSGNLLIDRSDYLGEVTTDVDIQNASYKQEVNNWCNGFKSLPVNQWYGNLLNTIGVGQTNNSVMNVIYVYPLYVLWVYILDVIVDCFLVIINFGHNALHRLGGDNE